MLNSKGPHPVGSRRRSSDAAEWSCVAGLKLRWGGREGTVPVVTRDFYNPFWRVISRCYDCSVPIYRRPMLGRKLTVAYSVWSIKTLARIAISQPGPARSSHIGGLDRKMSIYILKYSRPTVGLSCCHERFSMFEIRLRRTGVRTDWQCIVNCYRGADGVVVDLMR